METYHSTFKIQHRQFNVLPPIFVTMAKIIQFPLDNSDRRSLRKAKRRKKNPEDLGQLNLFKPIQSEGKIVGLPPGENYFESGLILLDSNPDRAEECLLKSVESEDHKADAYCNLGIIAYLKKDSVRAIDYFTKALEQEPRHFESHFNLANIYFEIGNYKLASVHYGFASEIEPEDANVRYNLGLVLANLNEYDKAIAQLEKYQDLNNGSDQEVLKLIATLRGTSNLNS